MLGENAASSDIQAARHAYGLDVPLGQQYVNYWKGVAARRPWTLFSLDQPVSRIILQRYPATLL